MAYSNALKGLDQKRSNKTISAYYRREAPDCVRDRKKVQYMTFQEPRGQTKLPHYWCDHGYYYLSVVTPRLNKERYEVMFVKSLDLIFLPKRINYSCANLV